MLAAVVIALLALLPTLHAQAIPQTIGIVQAAISQSEDGPPVANGFIFQPGDMAFFSFQVEGYKIGPNGKVQLTGNIEVIDPKGTPLVPVDEEVIGTSVGEEDKKWKPKLRLQFQLPSIGPPGEYKVKYSVIDQQTHRQAFGQTPLRMGGKGVEPAPVLTIRNLGFYRTQDDEAPLRIAAYKAGDILWVRFDVTGYKYGDQNAIDVAYDVAVLAPGGKQLFLQENAAVEKSQAFYPQPWVPGAFNLSLQSTMTPGVYTLVITARDGVGNQSATGRAEFKVE